MPNVIAFVGLSGVGKSTLIRALAERINLQHLSAGQLIGDEKSLRQEALDYDMLRLANINENQQLLINGFRRARDPDSSLIILDGHTVIDTGNELEPIPSSVFAALDVGMFVFVQAEPAEISSRRNADRSRNRPSLSLTEIHQHQEFAATVTNRIATELSIPCYVTGTDELDRLISVIET